MNTPLGDFSIRAVSLPAREPLTLNEIKDHLRIPLDFAEEDARVAGFGVAARQYLEAGWNMRALKQDVEYSLQQFPRADRIRIPIWPVQTFKYFRYVGSDQTVYEMNVATALRFRKFKKPTEIILPFGGVWPGVVLDTADGIQIGLTVGYESGESPELLPLPEAFKWAAKLLIGHMYENGSASTIGTLSKSDPLILSVDAYMQEVGLDVAA